MDRGPNRTRPSCVPGRRGAFDGDADDADAINSFGDWDSHKLHDPYLLKYRGQIWLYYKGVQYGRTYRHDLGIGWGVAIADNPAGPFIKSALKPRDKQWARDISVSLSRRPLSQLLATKVPRRTRCNLRRTD